MWDECFSIYVKGSLFEGYWFKVQSCHIKDWMYLYLWLYKLTCSKYCIQERDWLIVSLLCPIHHIVGLKLAGSKCDALHSWGRHQWRWRWWDGGELPPATPILIFCTRPRLPVFWAPPSPLQEAQNAKTFHWGIMSMALLDDSTMENLFRIISGDGRLLVAGSCNI